MLWTLRPNLGTPFAHPSPMTPTQKRNLHLMARLAIRKRCTLVVRQGVVEIRDRYSGNLVKGSAGQPVYSHHDHAR